ncbi:MAG: hypothetical protein LBV13_01045 [Methanomassiliicoccaceae archaeon]|jgi:hypothetical protein|nr:hypothetical protein [Methanomassiliicoccaceae archaeon]
MTFPAASASDPLTDLRYSAGTPGLSFSDLLGIWGNALADPATYATWGHIGGFAGFLMNETFLSALSSNSFSSLSRNSILGTIPNMFFVVCIACVLLSIAVAVMELKRTDMLSRVVKKLSILERNEKK